VTSSAPPTLDCTTGMNALLVIGSILLLAIRTVIEVGEGYPAV
jgi:hypothetical protein